MVSNILPILVCAAFVILLPAVWAEYCYQHWHTDGYLYKTQLCNEYCCGTCNRRYCCDNKYYRISQEKQEECTGGPIHEKHSKLAVILGSIFGVVIPVLFCVCLVICCVAPCCLFYKKCRKRRNRTVTTTTTVVNTPLQPLSPSGYQPSPPAYQPVPVRPVFTGPLNPTAPPPSYFEANSPTTNPPNPGQPMGLHPSQPPVFDDFSQPPYNPTYGLNRQV